MPKLILALCLLSLQVLGQSDADSLLRLLKNYHKEDTTKASYYSKIAKVYSYSDPETGLLYADSALQLSVKLNSVFRLANSYLVKALNLSSLGNDSAAVRFYQQSYKYFILADRENLSALALQNMGISYYNQSQYAKAIESHKAALAIFARYQHQAGIAAALNSLGVNYMDLSDYPRALENYFSSLKNAEAHNDSQAVSTSLSNIGLVYEKLGDFNKSLDYQNKALAIAQKVNNGVAIAKVYNNLGNLSDTFKKYSDAINFYNKALVINTNAENTFGMASNRANLGIVYKGISNYDSAYSNFSYALEKFEHLGDRSNAALMNDELGSLFRDAPLAFLLKHGLGEQQRWKKVMEYKNNALTIYKEIEDISGMADVYESLSNLYQKQGSLDLALESYKKYITLRDSVFNTENKVSVAKKELEYEYDKKQALTQAEHQKQIQLKEAEVARQKIVRNATAGGFAVMILAGAAGFISYKRRRDALQKAKEAQLQVEITDTEMKALRSQMNPHFIFNSLNSINDYVAKNESSTATLFTTKFARLMRLILEHSEKKEITVEDDLKALELYMQLESMRMNHKFTYEITVAKDVDKENSFMPPLILQPFVENSIWHGISKKEGNGKISINISRQNEMMVCTVTDDGVGRNAAQKNTSFRDQQNKKSLGMRITQERIDLLNKLKKVNASVALTDLPQGLRVTINLPYETRF